jgi:hypothetical protein
MTTPDLALSQMPAEMPVVVLIDVDGVVGPSGGQPSYEGEVVWADLPPGRMHFPRAVIDWLANLDTRTTVIWLTSWQDDAVTYLTPALGLPVWGYHARRDAPKPLLLATVQGWWKEAIVRAYLHAGYRVVWLDDDIAYRTVIYELLDEFDGQLLAISPNPGQGLTAQERAHVDAWLASAAISLDPSE